MEKTEGWAVFKGITWIRSLPKKQKPEGLTAAVGCKETPAIGALHNTGNEQDWRGCLWVSLTLSGTVMGRTFSHRVKRCGSLSTSQFASPPSALLLMIRSPIDWFGSNPLNPPDRDNSQLIDMLTPLRSAPLSLATIGRSICIRTSVKVSVRCDSMATSDTTSTTPYGAALLTASQWSGSR